MHKVRDLAKKVTYLRNLVGLTTVTGFATKFHEFTGITENAARAYAKKNEAMTLRGENHELLLKFWNQKAYKDKGTKLDEEDLDCSYEDFLSRRGVTDPDGRSPNHETSDADLHKHFSDLAGSYQIIRPHAVDPDFYVLEALGIEVENGRLVNTSYSHQEPTPASMYFGTVELGQRYYQSLLKRTGSHGPAYRCYTFFIGGSRYKGCLSGIMLRGMSGEDSDEKQAVALPFIAIPTSKSLSLREPDMVALAAPEEDADPIRLLHRNGDIVLGKVPGHWYPGVFGYCRDIFNNESFLKECRQHQYGLMTAPARVLKKMPRLTKAKWQYVTTDLKKALGREVCGPDTTQKSNQE